MAALKAAVFEIAPFAGNHPYCNKVSQCFSDAFLGYDKIVLTDCDLFFSAPPPLPLQAEFAGKVVDMPNPTIEILEDIYRAAGVAPPSSVTSCSASDAPTFPSNLNGGFYFIDAAIFKDLGRAWNRHALWLGENVGLLGSYSNHVDQVAMALALNELGINVSPLPIAGNYPIHLPRENLDRPASFSDRIAVFHYHSSVLPTGHIAPTGLQRLDELIAAANRQIDDILNGETWDQHVAKSHLTTVIHVETERFNPSRSINAVKAIIGRVLGFVTSTNSLENSLH